MAALLAEAGMQMDDGLRLPRITRLPGIAKMTQG